MFNSDELQAKNERHLAAPEVGDYWEDHLVGVCVVLAVNGEEITVCRKKKDVDMAHWAWDLAATETLDREAFAAWLRYTSIPGTWATVHPGAHAGFARSYVAHGSQAGQPATANWPAGSEGEAL